MRSMLQCATSLQYLSLSHADGIQNPKLAAASWLRRSLRSNEHAPVEKVTNVYTPEAACSGSCEDTAFLRCGRAEEPTDIGRSPSTQVNVRVYSKEAFAHC